MMPLTADDSLVSMLYTVKCSDPITPVLHTLQWLPTAYEIKSQALHLVLTALQRLTSTCLAVLLSCHCFSYWGQG